MSNTRIQYVSDADGKNVGVIVPMELWKSIQGELETAYLLKSKKMKQRLVKSIRAPQAISFEEVREKLGI